MLAQTENEPETTFESKAWSAFPAGWRQLYGDFPGLGLSFEWHDFKTDAPFLWSPSFHPDSVEICLNLDGSGTVETNGVTASLFAQSTVFYAVGEQPVIAMRGAGERHQFITIELSQKFLKTQLSENEQSLNPIAQAVIESERPYSGVSEPNTMSARQRRIANSLRRPPVLARAQPLWYRAKALEAIAEFLFFEQPEGESFFCVRQQNAAKQRIERVVDILHEEMVEPPTLEALGKRIGCSHYYLSRTFSKEMGITIPQYLRQIRIARASELLKSGRYNVTEAAMEVGYNSLSHFSHAFRQETGYCPGLFPVESAKK